MQGFLIFDHVQRHPEALRELENWVLNGQIRYREDILDGLEEAPGSIAGCTAARISASVDSDRSGYPRLESPPLRKPGPDTRRSGHSPALAPLVRRPRRVTGATRHPSGNIPERWPTRTSRRLRAGANAVSRPRRLSAMGAPRRRAAVRRNRALLRGRQLPVRTRPTPGHARRTLVNTGGRGALFIEGCCFWAKGGVIELEELADLGKPAFLHEADVVWVLGAVVCVRRRGSRTPSRSQICSRSLG